MRAKAIVLLLGGVLALGLVGLASIVGSGSSEAQQDTMHNCPQPARWAISVWGGADGMDTGQALVTCGPGAVDAAYSLDPQTGVWSRWFAGRPAISNLSSLDNMQGVLALGAVGGPPPTVTPTPVGTPTPAASATPVVTPTATPGATWTGVWNTNWGSMELTQSDGIVTGTYEHDQGEIEGTVQGNKLIGTWSEYPSYAPPDDAGEFEFIMSPDGDSFLGRWRYDSAGDWQEWSATRAG